MPKAPALRHAQAWPSRCALSQADAAAARAVARISGDDVAAVLQDSSLTAAERTDALNQKKRLLHDLLGQAGMLRHLVCSP